MEEPFAVEIYRQFLDGRSAQQLSADLGISLERVEQRLRAAARYLGQPDHEPGSTQDPSADGRGGGVSRPRG